MHIYDRVYYNYINTGSIRSAEALVPIVTRHLPVRSVADFGAGQGAWLSVWQRLGVSDITALDGAYVDQDALLVPKHTFVPSDLSRPVRLGRTFDLVQSLEVAEHLPASAAETIHRQPGGAFGRSPLLCRGASAREASTTSTNSLTAIGAACSAHRGYVMFDLIRPFDDRERSPSSPGTDTTHSSTSLEITWRVCKPPFDRFQIDRVEPIPDLAPLRYRRSENGHSACCRSGLRPVLAVFKKQLYVTYRTAQPAWRR